MNERLTHLDETGAAHMVDVSVKGETRRFAVASGAIRMNERAYAALTAGTLQKGDALAVARVAAVQAVKRTAELIPLCHPLLTEKTSVSFDFDDEERTVTVRCEVAVTAKTGVEMEALTGVSVALLTLYDMAKALDKSMEIFAVHLLRKEGGKSGRYERA